jgi:hypothetical protein
MATISAGSQNYATSTRKGIPVSVGKQFIGKSLGLLITWTDDFTSQSVPTQLFRWGLSELPQPEITGDRASDWSGSLRG